MREMRASIYNSFFTEKTVHNKCCTLLTLDIVVDGCRWYVNAIDVACLLMIIPQLLDLSTTVSKLLIYFNINHVNDAPARQPSTSPFAFHEPPTLLRTPVPLLRLVVPGKQEMSISIKIDRHNYRWLPAPKFLDGVSDAHPLNFANEPGQP